MDTMTDRTWAEIDLSALEHNYRTIRAALPDGCRFLALMKANAYGHGAVPVAHRLEARGAAAFGVATADEALELRAAGIRAPIVILGYVDLSDLAALIRHDVTVPVYDHETAVLFSETAAAEGRALKVHFALDTGMSRIGFQAAETEATIAELLEISRLPGLESDGSIALRITKEPFSHELCYRFQKALVSTSANISGEPAAQNYGDISQELLDSVDYVCFSRRQEHKPHTPSSIVRLRQDGEVQIIRK